MPNKPDKFGIKFWLASDVSTKYIINGFPYLGKEENRGASTPLGKFVVLKLMEPFTGCGRSVTTDNFFTSASLATKLLEKRTTLVGTIRGNKRELPKLAKQKKDVMPRFSTKLYKSSHCSLTIYKSKPNIKVLLLSSKHKSVSIETYGKRIPETTCRRFSTGAKGRKRKRKYPENINKSKFGFYCANAEKVPNRFLQRKQNYEKLFQMQQICVWKMYHREPNNLQNMR